MMKINIPIEELLVVVAMHGYYFSRLDYSYTFIHSSESIFDAAKKECIRINNETLEVSYIYKCDEYRWEYNSNRNPTFYYMDDLKFIENYVDY